MINSEASCLSAEIVDQVHESFTEIMRKQSEIIKNLTGAIYACDKNGYVKFYNNAAAELWGREPNIGKDRWCGSWKIYESDGITPMPFEDCPMAIAFKEKRSVRDKAIVIERPDGIKRKIMPFPDPILNSAGEIVEAVNMLVDITETK